MAFYIILWGVFAFFYLFQDKLKKKIPSFVLWGILVFLSVVIVGCRYQVGNDWESYCLYYYHGYAYDKSTGAMEPLFTLVRYICFSLGLSHAVFFAILSFFSLFLIVKATENLRIRNKYFVLFAYLSLFFCSFQFNIIRQGLLASCVWYAFSEKTLGHNTKAFVWVLIGCGFHLSGFLFLPILFVIDKKLPWSIACLILIISYACFFLKLSERLMALFPFLANVERVATYLNASTVEYGLSIGMIFNTVLLLYSYICLYKVYDKVVIFRIVLNSLLIALMMSCMFNAFYTIVARIANVLNMALVFFWPMFIMSFRKRFIRIAVRIGMLIYLLLYFNISINTKANDTSMLPYRMEIEQLFE